MLQAMKPDPAPELSPKAQEALDGFLARREGMPEPGGNASFAYSHGYAQAWLTENTGTGVEWAVSLFQQEFPL